MDTQNLIGTRIRHLRQQQGRTQQEIAGLCGFTKSLLCKIESGDVYPPVATLVKIAAALGTRISALVQEGNEHQPVLTPSVKAMNGLSLTEKGYAVFPYAMEFDGKKMQPFLFSVKKGEVQPHSVQHQGEEFIYVIEGEILFRVGSVEHHMRGGDTLYFNAQEEHGVMAVSDSALYLDVFV